jgi:hypothetical protein
VERALKEYLAEVEASDLAHLTKATYAEHPRNFVRWLKGEFVPGGSLDGRGKRTDLE